MDSVKTLKLQALENYKRTQFLYNLVVYFLTTFLSTLFYLYLFWLPSMKHFFCIFLPNIYSSLLSPKVLFIVGNVIVLFLVKESRLGGGGGGSKYSSPASEIYDEYVQRSRSLGKRSTRATYYKKNKDRQVTEMQTSFTKCMSLDALSAYHKDEKENDAQVQTSKNGEAVVFKVDPVEGKLRRGGEEEEEKLTHNVLPTDELNRRVEEFIARVNRQRRLEERQVPDRW